MTSTETACVLAIRQFFDQAIIALFLAAIAAPMLTIWLPSREKGDEQRVRALYPERVSTLASLITYPNRLETYLNDHFGFRDRLLDAHHRLFVFGLRTSPSPKVVIGKKGWLYFNGDAETGDASPIQDYLGSHPLSPAKLESLRWIFQDQHEWLRRHGLSYTLVLIPSKPGLYPEAIPTRLQPTGIPPWREQLISYLTEHTNVPILDLTPGLLAASERRRIYIPTDTHWNDFGAYIGYSAITRYIAHRFPGLKVIPESAFDVLTQVEQGGDLAHMLGLEDAYCAPRIRMQPRTPRRGNPQTVAEGHFVNTIGGTGDSRQPNAYVYHDSYTKALIPFLTESFSKVEYEWGQKATRMANIESRRPDVVLQIMIDRVLNMDLIYAPRIRHEMTQERYAQAPTVVASASATNDFAGLTFGRTLSTSLHRGGLALELRGRTAQITLPPLRNTHKQLPIIHLQIRPTTSGAVALRDPHTPHPSDILDHRLIDVGRHDLYLSVLDPETHGHLILELDGKADYLLYAIDIRATPR